MRTLSKLGFFAGDRAEDGPLTIGGRVDLPGAVSPNNGLPLIQFASLRLAPDAFWIPNWKVNELRLLYAWKCNIHLGAYSYRQTFESITVVEYQAGTDGAGDDFPYPAYPETFEPVRLSLVRMSPADQDLIIAINADSELAFRDEKAEALSVPRHQFGGTPYLLQGSLSPRQCPLCHQEMQMIASIGNEAYSDARGFFGNDFVQLVYWCCVDCQTISVSNCAD